MWVGHELHVGDAVALDGGQQLERVEALHHHRGAAEALRADRPAGRGGVVQRRRAQVHRRRW